MDCILLVGVQEPKLDQLLSRMGAKVHSAERTTTIFEALTTEIIDAIVWEDNNPQDELEVFYRMIRETPSTKDAVLMFAGKASRVAALREIQEQHGDERLEIISAPYGAGTLIARLMTQLRLRKIDGTSETASLASINASLRDLTDRFQRELEEANAIQKTLLPQILPNSLKFELATQYQPLEGVGGDWYGVQTHPSGALTFQIADVTGHGLAAAFLGSMTSLALTAANREAPEELFTEMNRLLSPHLPEGRFITMAAVHYLPDSGAVSFARAGHLPGLIIRSNGEYEFLKVPGFAMGFVEDAEFIAESASLQIGDLFILCTDGITEAQNRSGVMYGMEGLIEGITLGYKDLHCSAEEIITRHKDHFQAFCEERLIKDDITIIVLKRTA